MAVGKTRATLEEVRRLAELSFRVVGRIELAGLTIADALKRGNKILICGNGGSAAEALHFGGELVGRFKKERKALPAIVLGSNLSTLTAVANDYNYESVFAREVEAFGVPGDVLVVFSTSGNSKNVIAAVAQAYKQGLEVVGFLGCGGVLKHQVHDPILVASSDTPRIQEMHQVFVHVISELVEENLFGVEMKKESEEKK